MILKQVDNAATSHFPMKSFILSVASLLCCSFVKKI